MNRTLIDADSILSEIDQWNNLDIEWGTPVDLDAEDQELFTPITSCVSTLNKQPTFDSAGLLKRIHEKICRGILKKIEISALDYDDFLQDLDLEDHLQPVKEKQFYYVGGEIISAFSVDNICNRIDNIFKSIDKLCAVSSTLRIKDRPWKMAEVVECSISPSGLSFDDTGSASSPREVDSYIDGLFNKMDQSSCQQSSAAGDKTDDQSQESVTTLVRKFSSFLDSPMVKCHRRSKRCSDKFNDLAEFWRKCSGE